MSLSLVSKPVRISLAVGGILTALSVQTLYTQMRPPILEIYVCALKSGHSMFIRTPDDTRILVNGGGNAEIIRLLTHILPFYSRRIDMVFATDTQAKNITGLVDVAERYTIGHVYIPKFNLQNTGITSSSDASYSTFIKVAQERNVQITELDSGRVIRLSPGIDMNILFPIAPREFSYSKVSAPELLFGLKFENTAIVYMGEASKKVQRFIAASVPVDIKNIDVLITSTGANPADTSPEFMSHAQPTSLIYAKTITKNSKNISTRKSAAKKSADPFAMILLDQRFNVKELGTIKITSDGKVIRIAPWD